MNGSAALLDERDIGRVCLAYADALDQKDWPALRQCFVADAVADYEGIGTFRGIDAIIERASRGLRHLDRSQHIVTNVLVDVEGDTAVSSCYLQAQHVRSGTSGGDTFIIAGRYADRFVRAAAGWRIEHRRLEIWWTGGNPAVVRRS
jgi:ketosteroid isomerase-like protein